MPNSEFSDDQVLNCWHKNAHEWTKVVDNAAIPSRRLVTDAAIVSTIIAHQPENILDIGCGEGWLSRKFAEQGIRVCGIDGVKDLVDIASARAGANESYRHLQYEEICAEELEQKFQLMVCNFSLIGKDSVEQLFSNARELLLPGGHFIIQTLHPHQACGDQPYRDGWRPGSWEGIEGDFDEAAPWYFRTLESWIQLFHDNGFAIERISEPKADILSPPSSLIICAKIMQ
ncbi:SAM-dependent methyltransferase [Microbulbifer sp. A4B17]|uniref:class I SAM-dependent DNA methyltransferase n=1 Tax=Microbulbifer sp. A4B17 TaxID=359370 RepID=UPI000D52E72F|nr:class I SAM-dependent methyltransferase [Microbulbifer sp. A4B17]AWF80246.1 SAM-dependent methyltransferase [Microbulbifer sp. A4B17]